MQTGQINYIEFPVANVAKAKKFYGEAFGWTFQDYGPNYASFSDGNMDGGFNGEAPVRPGGGTPLVIIYAADLEAMEKRVTGAGAKIVRPTFSFPGGRRFHFSDPDGHELAVWSDK